MKTKNLKGKALNPLLSCLVHWRGYLFLNCKFCYLLVQSGAEKLKSDLIMSGIRLSAEFKGQF